MSDGVAKLRRRVAERRGTPRLGDTPSTVVDVDTAEALCDLYDAVRLEHEVCAGEHCRVCAALARVDRDLPPDTRPGVHP